jgi:CBS domain-containing protein
VATATHLMADRRIKRVPVIDRDGRLKLVLPFGVTADEIADDLNYMLR